MTSLNEACLYLLKNWNTYLEMKSVETEIDNKYLIPISVKVESALKKHKNFPIDWIVEAKTDNEEAGIYALPQIWKNWNKHEDWLGNVGFYNLRISELLAEKRDERAWFVLEFGLGNRQDQLSIDSAEKLWDASKDYTPEFNGFERPEEYDKETCFYKSIERMPINIIQNESKLIKFIVDGMIPIIKIVDNIKKKHFSKNPSLD